jgi:putative ABC transport system permease protein
MPVFRVIGLCFLALERLLHYRGLVVWVLLGLLVATTLAASLPLYVDAVNTTLLVSHLDNPPFAFRLRYIGSWTGNITSDKLRVANAVVDRFAEQLQLPILRRVTVTSTTPTTLRSADGAPLGTISLGMLEGGESQVSIIAGEWPPPSLPDGVVPVMLAETTFFERGIQVGDTLALAGPQGRALDLQVVALWRLANPDDPAWIFPSKPEYFQDMLLTSPEQFWLMTQDAGEVIQEVGWYLIFDGHLVRTSNVGSLADRIADNEREVTVAFSGIRVEVSPLSGLRAFRREVQQLSQQLLVVFLPIGWLILAFVSSVAGLLVDRQRLENATLSSRGMSRWALLSVDVGMWLILVTIALLIGLALTPPVVRLVARTTSFLKFGYKDTTLRIVFTSQAVLAGGMTGLAASGSGLYLVLRASGQTINLYKQSIVSSRRAWWQRVYLDVILLLLAGYVLYTLSKRGGISTSAENPFADPLVFLGPMLFSFSLSLLFLRLWLVILRAGARLAALSRGMVWVMVLRELTRSSERYRGTLIMTCFTLSLAGFTASMASTVDRSLEDAVKYKSGADIVLVPAVTVDTTDRTVTGYRTLPIGEVLDIPGVTQAVRVGRYAGRIALTGQLVDGTILGIDRTTMATVAYFRSDYATEPLADLMNRLAINRNGVLLDRETAERYRLHEGQEITVKVQALGDWSDMKVLIVGIINYFPTLDPRQGFFMLTNLDPIFEMVGAELPHDFWLTLDPTYDRSTVLKSAQDEKIPILDWRDTQQKLHLAQASPSRRGVLGFLSIGFVAATLLTLMGAIIQNIASFRSQATYLGILRSMGLVQRDMGRYLIFSQGIVTLSGILGGLGIGLATTLLFLPLLDFSGGVPPYLLRVEWGQTGLVYGIFAGMVFGVTLFMTALMNRERMTTLIKMGDV